MIVYWLGAIFTKNFSKYSTGIVGAAGVGNLLVMKMYALVGKEAC